MGARGLVTGGSAVINSKTVRAAVKKVEGWIDDAYQGLHRAPMKGSGAPAYDLTGGGTVYPDDIYSPEGLRYYGTGQDRADAESMAIIRQLKDNPNQKVTMYRAVPYEAPPSKQLAELEKQMNAYMRRGRSPRDSNLSGSDWYNEAWDRRAKLQEMPDPDTAINKINEGDWVSLSRTYAKEHGESTLGGNYKIITKKVPAKHLFTNGDSFNEFGYDPRMLTGAGTIGLGALAAGGSQDAEAGPVKILSHIDEAGKAVYKTVIDAWHGSPHKFDKFSMDNIGTGEGAQAYGHGLYFADSPDVAKQYRQDAGINQVFGNYQIPDPVYKEIQEQMLSEKDWLTQTALEGLLDGHRPPPKLRQHIVDIAEHDGLDADNALRVLDEAVAKAENYKGALYRTQIDVDPDTLLDWDKPLSEQPAIMERLGRLHTPTGNMADDAVTYFSRDKKSNPTGSDLMDFLRNEQGSAEGASASAKQIGIPGIRYLDGDSRNAGQGTYNYVMFDDAPISIKERGNADPRLLAGAAGLTAGGMALGSQEAEAGTVSTLVTLPDMVKALLKRGVMPTHGPDYRQRDIIERLATTMDGRQEIGEQMDNAVFIRKMYAQYAKGNATSLDEFIEALPGRNEFNYWIEQGDEAIEAGWNTTGAPVVVLDKVYIDPQNRGKGLGREIMNRGIDDMAQKYPGMEVKLLAEPLDGSTNSEDLIRLYESSGFDIGDYQDGMSGIPMEMTLPKHRGNATPALLAGTAGATGAGMALGSQDAEAGALKSLFRVVNVDDSGRLVSQANSRVNLPAEIGASHDVPMWMTPDKKYAVDNYSNGSWGPGEQRQVLVEYEIDTDDILQGNLSDLEPEVSVSRGKLKSITPLTDSEYGNATPTILAGTAAATGAGMAINSDSPAYQMPPAEGIDLSSSNLYPQTDPLTAYMQSTLGDFSARRAKKRDMWDTMRAYAGEIVNGPIGQATGFAVDSVRLPLSGINGLSMLAGRLAQGEGFSDALQAGAEAVENPATFEPTFLAADTTLRGLMAGSGAIYDVASGKDMREIGQNAQNIMQNDSFVTGDRWATNVENWTAENANNPNLTPEAQIQMQAGGNLLGMGLRFGTQLLPIP